MRATSAIALVIVAVVVAGCHDAEKEAKATFAAAEVANAEAQRCVAAGDHICALDSWRKVDELTTSIRRKDPHQHFGDETMPPGPVFRGLTVEGWQQRWLSELKDTLRANFDVWTQRARDGKIDWMQARSFIYEYGGRDLDERWSELAKGVDVARIEREGKPYVFRCVSVDDGLCDAVRPLLAAKLARPVMTGALTSGADEASSGVVSVDVGFGGAQDYTLQSADPSTPGEVTFRLATRLDLAVTVTPTSGTSSWSTPQRVNVENPAPDAIGGFSRGETEQKQEAALRAKLTSALAALPSETITP